MSQTPQSPQENLKMYTDLAAWWPLLSAPEDYAEEAAFYHQILQEATERPPQTLLELGSGGGNNASYLKAHYQMTLVDLSEGMLAVSQDLNPECEHFQGDMRTVRLGREFDAVFIHDAVDSMLTEEDLRQAMATAALHCQAGGVALFAPDYVREIFVPSTDHGGHDGQHRALRYLEWTYDPDENDTTYTTDYAYLLREGDQIWVEHDRHICGLFKREEWLQWLTEAGFATKVVVDSYERELFVGVKVNQPIK
jgi:trans-aconitate methyltransferase